ncbi:MAG: hypothetical protein GY803_31810 [Chloroflexi bacterium]|nr:hypothetical protein [Chloroflexota bacterium]
MNKQLNGKLTRIISFLGVAFVVAIVVLLVTASAIVAREINLDGEVDYYPVGTAAGTATATAPPAYPPPLLTKEPTSEPPTPQPKPPTATNTPPEPTATASDSGVIIVPTITPTPWSEGLPVQDD